MADKTTFYKGLDQISVTPEEAQTFQGGTSADAWKGLVASGWSSTKPVSGSSDARDKSNQEKQNAADLYKDITNVDTSTTIDDIKAAIGYRDPNTALTSDEQASIDRAGEYAGGEYDPLIQKVTEAKRQGLPKAYISAGERGGFMSTQMSGVSALTPTQGGDFIGSGGELSNIKSEYDNNIANLNTQKLRAIQLAKQKAEEAIRTGKSEANDQARQLFQLAQDANTKSIEMAQKKVDLISSYTKANEAKLKYNTDMVSNLAETGSPLTDELKSGIDAQYGDGYADKLYTTSQKALAAEDEKDQTALLKDVYSILDKVPVGKTVTIGNNTYEGMQKNDSSHVYKETDKNGNVVIIEFDPLTKEVKSYTSGVKVKQSGSGGGGGSTAGVNISNDVSGLLATRGFDGYVNTQKYAELYDKYAAQGSKKLAEFAKSITPEVYLNPQDATAKKYIQSATQALKGAEDNSANINALIEALNK